MHLRSAGATTTLHSLGADLSWQDEVRHLVRPEEQIYIDVLNASGAVTPIDPEKIPGDKSLVLHCGTSGVGTLEGDQQYSAVLALSPTSNFSAVAVAVQPALVYMKQDLPMMITSPAAGVPPNIGDYPLLGKSADFQGTQPTVEPEPNLFEFGFRTSRFLSFSDVFARLARGQTPIRALQIQDAQQLRDALDTLANVSMNTWRPAQMAVLEKQLLVQQGFASNEELLELTDKKAEINAQLDRAFGDVLAQLPNAGGQLEPLPPEVQLYFSAQCLLFRLPEPMEFSRVSVECDGFDVLVACSPDEAAWLVFPVDPTQQFTSSGTITLTYKLDIGPDLPRLRYGSLSDESVEILLGSQGSGGTAGV